MPLTVLSSSARRPNKNFAKAAGLPCGSVMGVKVNGGASVEWNEKNLKKLKCRKKN